MSSRTATSSTDSPVRPATVAGLAVALLALPALVAVDALTGLTVSRAAGIAAKWAATALLLAVVVGREGRGLPSMGLRRPEPIDAGYAVLAFVLGLLAFVVTDPLVAALGLEQATGTGLDPAGAVGLALVGAVTAGVTEELLFRGYAIERLTELTGGVALAGAASWGTFTVAHAPSYPAGNLLQVSAAALVFTLLYLHRRSILPLVVGHALIDVFGVVGAVYG